jgi:hypothetical protein
MSGESLQSELQGQDATMVATNNGGLFAARVAAGMVNAGFKVEMSEPAAPGAQARFNMAEAGMKVAGTSVQPAGPTAPAPELDATQPATPDARMTAPVTPGMG